MSNSLLWRTAVVKKSVVMEGRDFVIVFVVMAFLKIPGKDLPTT